MKPLLAAPRGPMPVPRAIWMATPPELPSCYQGSPLEMVEAMASEMYPGLSTQEAIDRLRHTLLEARRIQIQIPDGSIEQRAAFFVVALLVSGIAHPMPSA